MVHLCTNCGKRIEDDERVKTEIVATYHYIPSSRIFAIGKDFQITGSLTHEECKR